MSPSNSKSTFLSFNISTAFRICFVLLVRGCPNVECETNAIFGSIPKSLTTLVAEIAISTARVVRLFGFDPKVAFVSHSTFGQPLTSRTKHIRSAVEILKERKVDFEFDGDMQPDVALNPEYEELYPFAKIVGKANILIMPGQHSAAISYKLMKTIGETKVIGPLLIGLGLPIEIAPLRSSTSEILNLASIAAYSSQVIDYKK